MRSGILFFSVVVAYLILTSACFAGPQVLEVSPAYLEFSAYEGGIDPCAQVLSIWNSGHANMDWTVTEDCNWILVEPNTGSSSGEVDDANVFVDISGLVEGTYNCQLTVTGAGAPNSPQIVDVNLTVIGPEIQLSATQFEFTTFEGGANPNDQILTISNSGGGTLNWQITEDCNWLMAEPNSGSSTGETDDVNLSVDITGSAIGTYNCQLTVSDSNAANSPQTVSVTLYVYPYFEGALYVPSEYSTIQSAIDAAVDGNTIIVAPGTYTGTGNRDLDFGGKAITVSSTDPNDPNIVAATIIDCNGSAADLHRGFNFHSGEGPNSIVSGLTIRNGYAGTGGGIRCNGSSPTISWCVVVENSANGDGGGISINGYATISHCIVMDNTAGDDGGGIFCELNRNPKIINCVIAGNSCTGNLGDGGGIYYYSSGVNISHCTVVDNTTNVSSNTSGGGIFGWKGEIKHCIAWGNTAHYASQIYSMQGNVSYCDIQGGYSGEGNIDADPCFVNASAGDYHLLPNSPCRDAGDPVYISNQTDIDGEPRKMGLRVDIGADEFTDEVLPEIPLIQISSTDFSFYANEDGTNPNDQILTISNSGTGTLNWQITEDCNWLTAEPNSGSSTGETDDVNLSVDITGLSVGAYNCQLTVSDSNAGNSPQIVSINLYVCPYFEDALYVPSEYSTIQAAIDVAVDGNTIIVAPGTYTGTGNKNLDFGGKAITVRSFVPEDPCIVAATIIDCGNSSRGFYFHSGEGSDSIIHGLTVKNGKITGDPGKGGGIYCSGSSPTIKNCIITDNRAVGLGGSSGETGKNANGGGIYCESDSNAIIIDCKITNNSATGGYGGSGGANPPFPAGPGGDARGGGIFGSSLTIENCIISGNTSQGGNRGSGGSMPVPGGAAWGGGIRCGPSTINNCTIINNTASIGAGDWPQWAFGGGISGSASTIITNCILWDNDVASALSPDDVDLYSCSATYSCIEDGDAGVGNISADPCFVSGPLGDYYLSQILAGQVFDSPCVDAGSDTAANLGMDIFTTRTDHIVDGGIVDIGYHYPTENPVDIDDNGSVDFVDFEILASQWQEAPGIPSADIVPPGGNGIVDIWDLGLLVRYWLWQE